MKRLMLILAIGVSFTSVCFAGDGSTGQHVANSDYGVGSTDCGSQSDKTVTNNDQSGSQGSGGTPATAAE